MLWKDPLQAPKETIYNSLKSSRKQKGLVRCHGGLVQVRKPDRRRWCAERMLNFRSLKKAVDIRAQLAQHLKQLKVGSHPARPLLTSKYRK